MKAADSSYASNASSRFAPQTLHKEFGMSQDCKISTTQFSIFSISISLCFFLLLVPFEAFVLYSKSGFAEGFTTQFVEFATLIL